MEQRNETNHITHAIYVVKSGVTHQNKLQAMGLIM
jgi:hypothetical protein